MVENQTQNTDIKTLSFDKRKEIFLNEIVSLAKQYNLTPQTILSFPQYNILPSEVELALLILKEHKAQYIISCNDVKELQKEETHANQS